MMSSSEQELSPSLVAPLEPAWEQALSSQTERFASIREEITRRRELGEDILPAPTRVLRAFRQPFDRVKVIILGQDPYPTPGHPIGMSFAVAPDVRPLPRSLQNIFKEREDDLGLSVSPSCR